MTDFAIEKQQTEHIDQTSSMHHDKNTVGERGFDIESEELPKGYYLSPFFLGTTCAIGINLMVSISTVIWLSLVYTMGLAVSLLLVGRLSDIFGRRWFFICGTALGVIGAVVASTAKNINVLIGGQVLIGLSASTGYSYAFIIGELVPVKRRFLFNAIIFIFSFPTAGFGAAVSAGFILHTSAGWRLVLFILGLSSGGSLYPWKDAHVVAPLVIGFLCLVALFAYETLVDLKEPLMPMHFFRNRGWVASMLSLSLGASVYYSQAIVWPEMATNVYGQGRLMWSGWVSCLVGIGITFGEILGGGVAKNFGHWKIQCISVFTLGTLFLGLTALCTPETPKMAMAFIMIATTFIGWNEALVLPICTIAIRDQEEIGTAAGIAGSSRSTISTVASTVYSIVLGVRVKSTLTTQIPAAMVAAGLPASSIADYMTAIAAGGTKKLLDTVPGLTPEILADGANAYRHAYADAYKTIFLVSLAFGGLGILVSFFIPDIDALMGDRVATTLKGREKGFDVDMKHEGA
ncbi:MFS general substrate transporter [Lophiostoma macrostomum CBS 122681]|uniref:MFS general substrate transporter n=1 Tax=Lophiostoma macrostomum CBS 122681 TaxID=1314788 RepID=A0A6A6SXG3_9PLEO|nr:MFS general substrate transporter [Lophiostoma macrostomum CBS 122681]